MQAQSHPKAFALRKPVLVKPLSPDALEIFQQHGCQVEAFPPNRPDIIKGHMVTFPSETMMDPNATNTQYIIYFPDGYSATLTWKQNAYYLYPEQSEGVAL